MEQGLVCAPVAELHDQLQETLVQDLLQLAELGESGARDIEKIDLSEILTAHGTDFITLNPSRNVTLAISQGITVEASRDYMARFIQNAPRAENTE